MDNGNKMWTSRDKDRNPEDYKSRQNPTDVRLS